MAMAFGNLVRSSCTLCEVVGVPPGNHRFYISIHVCKTEATFMRMQARFIHTAPGLLNHSPTTRSRFRAEQPDSGITCVSVTVMHNPSPPRFVLSFTASLVSGVLSRKMA
jgi:hypothetical protein